MDWDFALKYIDGCYGILGEDVLHWFVLWNICLMMKRYVAFSYTVFVSLCEAVLLCLPEAPDCLIKN